MCSSDLVQGVADGPAMEAQFSFLHGLALDRDGNLLIADLGANKVRMLSPAAIVSTLAGSTEGFADGTGSRAQLAEPRAVAPAREGGVFVADTRNNRIRHVDPSGTVKTLAGDGTSGYDDGVGTIARFFDPHGLAADEKGNLFITGATARVRILMSDGVVRTLTGGVGAESGYRDGPGEQA